MNCELIKTVESTPDTIITLTTDEKIMVKESVTEIIDATIRFKHKINQFPNVGEGK